ncbi:MAG: hypothetical protein M3R53_03340 [Candidatus Eremiobacteraeota bacterium]|nr:hypothetical protein [Candidatus Eremiobacteraeota bacterium]
MKEPTSPFDLYGQLVTMYVNACLKANRAWLEHATALASAFVPRPVGEWPRRSTIEHAQAPAAPAAMLEVAPPASASVPELPNVTVDAPVLASSGASNSTHVEQLAVASEQAAAEFGHTSIAAASNEPHAAMADQSPTVVAAEPALTDPDILAAVREVVQLAPKSAIPKRARRPGLRRKP